MLIALVILAAEQQDLLSVGGPIAAVTGMLGLLVVALVKNMGSDSKRADQSTALVIATYEVLVESLTADKAEAEGRWENERAEKQAMIVRYERVLAARDVEIAELRDRSNGNRPRTMSDPPMVRRRLGDPPGFPPA